LLVFNKNIKKGQLGRAAVTIGGFFDKTITKNAI
jgi:hypothetical protein